MSRATRISLFLAAFSVFAAAFATSAYAVPGDSIANAVSLNSYMGSTITTNLVNDYYPGGGATGKFYFAVQLNAGNTLRLNLWPKAVVNLKALALPFATGYRIVESVSPTTTLTQMTFMAPVTGRYNFYLGSSTPGTFTAGPLLIPAINYAVKPMTAPAKAKPYTWFSVAVAVTPAYDGPTSPIKFVLQKKNTAGVYKYYATKNSVVSAAKPTYTTFRTSLKLAKGTYRVKAAFKDAAHATTKYNAYKTFYVKY